MSLISMIIFPSCQPLSPWGRGAECEAGAGGGPVWVGEPARLPGSPSSLASHCTVLHRSVDTLSISVFSQKQDVGSFIFLKGIALNVIYCSSSEFSGVFFSVSF